MTTSTSRLSYPDCYDLFDKALGASKGVRAKFPDWNSANYFRLRCHRARQIVRNENATAYQDDHPLHGKSEYDPLTLEIRTVEDEVWLYVRKHTIDGMEVEEIEEDPPKQALSLEIRR